MVHPIPPSQDSGCPPRTHLESTAPPNAALPLWGDKWKQQLPLFLLPAGEVMLQQGLPAARRGPTDREAAAGYAAPRGEGPRSGRGRAGAALTSSTVSGMQIRYSFSSMVLPGAGPRGGKRGAPPRTNKAASQAQGRAPVAPRSGAGRRSSPGAALSSWLPPLRPRACQGSGPSVRGSPASFLAEVGPPGTRCCKVREGSGRAGGRPAGNRSDRQPWAVGAATGSGHARWRAMEEKREISKN